MIVSGTPKRPHQASTLGDLCSPLGWREGHRCSNLAGTKGPRVLAVVSLATPTVAPLLSRSVRSTLSLRWTAPVASNEITVIQDDVCELTLFHLRYSVVTGTRSPRDRPKARRNGYMADATALNAPSVARWRCVPVQPSTLNIYPIKPNWQPHCQRFLLGPRYLRPNHTPER